MSAFRRALQRPWLVGAFVLAAGGLMPPVQTAVRSLANIPATSRLLGSAWAVDTVIVDGSGNPITSFGGGTQYAEDAVHASGDTGTVALGVRKDTAAALAGADGDYMPPIFDGSGRLWVNCGSGCGGSGGTSIADDSGFTAGTTSVTPAGAMFDNVSPDSVDENDIGVVRMSANRNMFVTLRDAAGNERGLNIDASGNLTANITGTVTVGSHAVTNAGTFATQDAGTVAHDAVGTGVNPLLVGGYASAAAPTDVSADGDAVRAWLLRSGAQVVQPSFAGVLATTGNGVAGTGVQRVTLASDSTGILASIGSITSAITPGTAAANLGKAEDAAHASGDTLVAIATKRTDTAASSAGTDGDYATLNTDASGRLWVICGSGCSGGTQYAEDAAHVSGDSGTLALAVRRDSAASGTSADGDYASLNVDGSGRLWVICGSGCSGGTQYAEDQAHTTGDSGTMALAIRGDSPGNTSSATGDYEPLQVSSGLLWARLRGLQTPNGDSVLDDTADAVKTVIVDSTGTAIAAGVDCDSSVVISTASSGSTQLVSLSSGQTIYICGYNFMAGGTANVKLVYGTGSNCGTGSTDLTGAYPLIAQTGVAYGSGSGYVSKGAASNAVCVNLSAAVQVSGILSYTKF